MLCLGIDSETKGTKTLVLDIESGAVLALAQESYGTIEGLPPGNVDQDPQTWLDARRKDRCRLPRKNRETA